MSEAETETTNAEAWRGKVGKLTAEELDAFLAGGHVARLGVLDEIGWPYVVPTWYQWADGGFYIIPRARSKWARFMANDHRVSISLDSNEPPYIKVQTQGVAELLEEPNIGGRWVDIATEMSVRYLGENGPKYLEPTLGEPRWLFFVRPAAIQTWQGVDWAKKYKHSDWGAS
ncbi:MAG: pyridoxamine 5'-phosphate oxidase family protein [Thermomicrobiales bacterium]|nr:pyridoxamine 5'-phosphate oxidase family protein [Thermomicrobiales bacterium]